MPQEPTFESVWCGSWIAYGRDGRQAVRCTRSSISSWRVPIHSARRGTKKWKKFVIPVTVIR